MVEVEMYEGYFFHVELLVGRVQTSSCCYSIDCLIDSAFVHVLKFRWNFLAKRREDKRLILSVFYLFVSAMD